MDNWDLITDNGFLVGQCTGAEGDTCCKRDLKITMMVGSLEVGDREGLLEMLLLNKRIGSSRQMCSSVMD